MKKIYSFLIVIFIATIGHTQGDSTLSSHQPTYLRFPTPPPIRLLLTDSTTYFTKENLNKKAAIMIMLFNPDCDHCKKETQEILDSISKFKNIQIIMATFMPFDMMKEFYQKFNLANYKNIIVGKDVNNVIIPFYKVANLPFLAFYNKKHNLISVFEGSLPVPKILAEFDKG